MNRHRRRLFKRSAVLEIGRDPRRPKRVIGDLSLVAVKTSDNRRDVLKELVHPLAIIIRTWLSS